ASLFTGRYASAHGAHDEHAILDAATPTLAERFAAAGWTTRAYSADPWLTDAHGTTRGFAWTDEGWRRGDRARALQSTHRLLDRLGLVGDDEPDVEAADGLARWIAARPAADGPALTVVDFAEAYHRLPAEYLGRFTTRSRRELGGVGTQLVLGAVGGAPPVGPDAIEHATALYDAGIAHADA